MTCRTFISKQEINAWLNRFVNPSQTFQNKAISFVYHIGIQRSKIDACGFLRVMSHTFADDGRYVFALGNTCPTVPRTIHRQWYWKRGGISLLLMPFTLLFVVGSTFAGSSCGLLTSCPQIG